MGYSPASAIPLSNFGAPTANIPMASHKFTGLLDGSVAGDTAGWDQLSTTTQQYAYVLTGCVWTADAAGTNTHGSMTSGTVVVNGLSYSVSSISAHVFAASSDTYVDINIQSGAAVVNYTAVTNCQTSPALVSSGTQYNTIRIAMVVTNTTSIPLSSNINQGSPSFHGLVVTATTAVAVGSNGAGFAATPLDVASTTGYASAGYLQIQHAQTPYLVQYTGTSGGNQFTGITGVAGASGGTVSTSDVVQAVLPCQVTDSLGNLIYPTRPFPTLIGYGSFLNAGFTTTNASTAVPLVVQPSNSCPGGGLYCPFIVPAGPSRIVKFIAHICEMNSSSAQGSTVQTTIAYGAAGGLPGTTASSAQYHVAVASDGMPIHPEGFAVLAPGSYTAAVSVQQSAAGTATAGVLFLLSALYVELV